MKPSGEGEIAEQCGYNGCAYTDSVHLVRDSELRQGAQGLSRCHCILSI